ncbi:hypothetical protein C2845_PM10G02380 [Panicum miliaceum]|uniref:KIB1-4 beta-propeller domain-containing protein n=1 Tax=Panicum miliaceum TaxID=4540 RepID=A0A3L6PI67_PANMI|nr:hypothetical protein C2845_PM10G02380 [Panicum miliaceum]
MPIPDDARYHGSIDNWLLLMQHDDRFFLVNPFSKTMLQLPKPATVWHQTRNAYTGNPLFYKLVMPSSLDLSSDSLVAVLIMDDHFNITLSICQPPFPNNILRKYNHEHTFDVVFFNGKLYAFISRGLFLVEIADNHKCKPKISSIKCVIDTIKLSDIAHGSSTERYLLTFWYYLVESGGRLLLVVRQVEVSFSSLGQHSRTSWFKVFEADMTANSSHKWRRVSSLAGQALFVGTYSKSLPATELLNVVYLRKIASTSHVTIPEHILLLVLLLTPVCSTRETGRSRRCWQRPQRCGLFARVPDMVFPL